MVNSIIQKRSDLKLAQDIFADIGTAYLKTWTTKELKKFRNEPVVIPYGNHGFLIGSFKIIGESKNCWKIEQIDGKHLYYFTSKQTAIIYCLCEITKKYKAANELLLIDDKIGKLNNDIIAYQHTLAKCKDKVKIGIVLNRYIEAKIQRRTYQNILKKTLISAKYMNFGNKPL